MTRKVWLLVALAAFLGGLSLYLNKDWFAKDNIQIYHHAARPGFSRRKRPDALAPSIVFGFDRLLKLTCIKVISLSDIKTNKYPHPIWHLVSESNSVPTRNFMYGTVIRGMHPAVKGTTPEPLEPGVGYRLVVEAGPTKGEHDFVPAPEAP